MIRRLLAGLLVVVVAAAVLNVIRNRSDDGGNQIEEDIRRAQIERGEIVVSVRATGKFVPVTEADLSFDRPGRIAAVRVEVGDTVVIGEELARLVGTDLALNVRQAEAALSAAQAQLDQLKAGARQEEVALAEANLRAAQAGLDGAEANTRDLENEPRESQVAAAEANLDAAEAGLWLATIQRDQITEGASAADIAAAEAQVASALLQQKVARDTHDLTLKCAVITLPNGEKKEICPGLGTAEEQARYNLYAADEAVKAAQTRLDQLLIGPTQEQIDTAIANVAAATAQRDAAQAQLELLLAGASAEQLRAAQANIAALTAQVDAAKAQRDLLLAGASVYQIAAAQANVDQAQVAVEMAQAELEKTVLRAPFDGMVTAVNLEPGQVAPTTLPAVHLADVSQLRIVVDVDEIDVARIEEGQKVSVSVDALPDEVFSGTVKRVAPAASQMAGVVVYQVTIVLDDTVVPLRIGMSAMATIAVEQLQGVLIVPNWAIRIDRDTGKTFVNLVRADTVEETEVEIGLRGEDVSQVLSGLQEGDVVAAGDVVGLRRLLDGED